VVAHGLQRDDRLCLQGDASPEQLLRAAGIERARGLISAIDSDEGAVYVTLSARALNPKLFILARAARAESVRRLELAGANRVVSPYEMAGRHEAELALRPDLDIVDPHRHGRAHLSVEELLVLPDSQASGHCLEASGLLREQHPRVLAVCRKGRELVVAPEPRLVLEEGDLVVAIGTLRELHASAVALR